MNSSEQTSTPMPKAKSLLVLSIGSLVLIIAGLLVRRIFPSQAFVCMNIGGLLAIAYLIMTLILARKRSAGRTVLSIFFSILLILGTLAGSAILLLSEIGADLSAPSLAESLEQSAVGATIPPQAFLGDSGASGVLPDSKWKDPNSSGSELPIKVKWVRNNDGVLVTASTDGIVPSGQSGTPFAQQFVGVDTLGMPLDWFASQAKGDTAFHVFDDWFDMFNDMVSLSAMPILKHAKSNDGSLPSAKVGETLLKDVKREFDFTYKFGNILSDSGNGDDKPVNVSFMIDRYEYETSEKDRFTIAYFWSCDSIPFKDGDSTAKDKVTGNFKIEFTAGGLMAMKRVDGKPSDPLDEVLEAYESSQKSRASKAEAPTD